MSNKVYFLHTQLHTNHLIIKTETLLRVAITASVTTWTVMHHFDLPLNVDDSNMKFFSYFNSFKLLENEALEFRCYSALYNMFSFPYVMASMLIDFWKDHWNHIVFKIFCVLYFFFSIFVGMQCVNLCSSSFHCFYF